VCVFTNNAVYTHRAWGFDCVASESSDVDWTPGCENLGQSVSSGSKTSRRSDELPLKCPTRQPKGRSLQVPQPAGGVFPVQ